MSWLMTENHTDAQESVVRVLTPPKDVCPLAKSNPIQILDRGSLAIPSPFYSFPQRTTGSPLPSSCVFIPSPDPPSGTRLEAAASAFLLLARVCGSGVTRDGGSRETWPFLVNVPCPLSSVHVHLETEPAHCLPISFPGRNPPPAAVHLSVPASHRWGIPLKVSELAPFPCPLTPLCLSTGSLSYQAFSRYRTHENPEG